MIVPRVGVLLLLSASLLCFVTLLAWNGREVKYTAVTGVADVAFVVPLAPKHFARAVRLSNSVALFLNKVDVYFVFTRESDLSNWISYHASSGSNSSSRSIVITRFFSEEVLQQVERREFLVNFKKFAALWILLHHANHAFLVVMDSEVEVRKHVDSTYLIHLAREFYNDKVFYGDLVSDEPYTQILRDSYNFLRAVNQSALPLTHPEFRGKWKDVYAWFFNVPLYERNHLIDFFTTFPLQVQVNLGDSSDFEHICFQHFLVAKHGWKYVAIQDLGYPPRGAHPVGEGEQLAHLVPGLPMVAGVKAADLVRLVRPWWLIPPSFALYASESPTVFMAFHIDRHGG